MRLSAPIYHLKRQAKAMARKDSVPLNKALDSIAKQQGFRSWSLLAADHARRSPTTQVFETLVPGDFVLLGARPGHGKTTMGLELVVQAINAGRQAAFYSLEYTESQVIAQLETLGADIKGSGHLLRCETSDEICADYIVRQMGTAKRGTVIVVDYLQLLDQNRATPPLATQVLALKAMADSAGLIFVMISQIDRTFDAAQKQLPDMADVRLPNPLDMTLFTKTVFLSNGAIKLQAVA